MDSRRAEKAFARYNGAVLELEIPIDDVFNSFLDNRSWFPSEAEFVVTGNVKKAKLLKGFGMLFLH